MANDTFAEAVRAVKAGERLRAKNLLTQLLAENDNNPDYWLWMSACVDSPAEQAKCLRRVLALDPNNVTARRGLSMVGALPADQAAAPAGPAHEANALPLPQRPRAPPRLPDWQKLRRSPEAMGVAGIAAIGLVAAIVALAVLGATGALRSHAYIVITSTLVPSPTAYPSPAPATLAPDACQLPVRPDPATPLAVYLCVTQTPTTPPWPTELPGAPREVYNRLKQAYLDGNWSAVLERSGAATSDPDVAKDPRIYFYTAEAYRHLGDFGRAMASYQSALQKDARFAPALWGRGLTHWSQGASEQALADFSRAIDADATFLPAWMDRAAYYSLAGQADNALADLENARRQAPADSKVLAQLALAYVESGNAQAGRDLAQAVLKLDPAQATAYFARGRAAYAAGDYAAADYDLSRSYGYMLSEAMPQPGPYQARIFHQVGLANWAVGDDAAALSMFNLGVLAYDGFGPLRLARGQLYLAAGNYDSALPDLAAAVTLLRGAQAGGAGLSEAALALGQTLMNLDRTDEALPYFEEATQTDPANVQAWLGQGEAELRLGRAEEAGASFEAALGAARTPFEQVRALFGRAQARGATGDTAGEAADLQALAKLLDHADALAPTVAARLTVIAALATPTPNPTPTPTP